MKRRPQLVRCRDAACPGFGHRNFPAAFSLIELLLVVVIVLVLATLYWSPNRASRQHALLLACQKNLQKSYIALEIYANDNGGLFPQVPGARSSEQALNVLVPKYTSDPSIFICPGSSDGLFGTGQSLLHRRISYAYYMGRGLSNAAPLMSDRQVDTRAKAAGEAAFSTTGEPPGNNHRKYGGNFLFCDGHVEQTPPNVPFALNLGEGETLLNP